MDEKVCEYCKGKSITGYQYTETYTSSPIAFTNIFHADASTNAFMDVTIADGNDIKSAIFEINYCPMCGRKLTPND